MKAVFIAMVFCLSGSVVHAECTPREKSLIKTKMSRAVLLRDEFVSSKQVWKERVNDSKDPAHQDEAVIELIAALTRATDRKHFAVAEALFMSQKCSQ